MPNPVSYVAETFSVAFKYGEPFRDGECLVREWEIMSSTLSR